MYSKQARPIHPSFESALHTSTVFSYRPFLRGFFTQNRKNPTINFALQAGFDGFKRLHFSTADIRHGQDKLKGRVNSLFNLATVKEKVKKNFSSTIF